MTKGGAANAQDMGRARILEARLIKPKRSSWTRPWEEAYKRGCEARLPEAYEGFGCFVVAVCQMLAGRCCVIDVVVCRGCMY